MRNREVAKFTKTFSKPFIKLISMPFKKFFLLISIKTYIYFTLQFYENLRHKYRVMHQLQICKCGPGQLSRYSDSLRFGRSGNRISVGARFSAPVQIGPEAPAAFTKKGTGFVSPGVKRSGRGVNHPPPSNAEVKERVELYFYSPSGPSWPVIGRTLPLFTDE